MHFARYFATTIACYTGGYVCAIHTSGWYFWAGQFLYIVGCIIAYHYMKPN